MSAQYLFQPFVWKHWPVPDVLVGWLEIMRDRVLVAAMIAIALLGATRVPGRALPLRAAVIGVAILMGATMGELGLLAFGSPDARGDAISVLGRIIQWIALALCVSGIFYVWMRSNEARAAALVVELLNSREQALLAQTQLQSLRQQIEPHFLFNTLATIRRLQETGPDVGTRLLHHLIQYLQSATPTSDQGTTLGEEVDLVASYLAIIAIRMSGRLTVRCDIADALRRCECPPLMLATLVENAVKHGITPAPAGGGIAIGARRDGELLEIVVADTGVGIPVEGHANLGGTGIGLANIRARLRALYGKSASFSLAGNAPSGVRAVLRVPFRTLPPS